MLKRIKNMGIRKSDSVVAVIDPEKDGVV